MIPKSTHHELRKSYHIFPKYVKNYLISSVEYFRQNELTTSEKGKKILRLKLGHENSYLFYLFYLSLCNEQLNHTATPGALS